MQREVALQKIQNQVM